MITFQILLGEDPGPQEVLEASLDVMEAAIAINRRWLRLNPEGKCLLYCDDVVYDIRNATELSRTIPIKAPAGLLRTGKGLCVDFVCLDVAVRRNAGQDAYPIIEASEAPGLYHILTGVRENGRERKYDPSKEITRFGRYVSGPRCDCS